MKRLCISLAILTCGLAPQAQAQSGGLMSWFAAPPSEEANACMSLPQAQRDQVHVLLINGGDPCNVCNFLGVRKYAKQLGFCNTTYYQLWDVSTVRDHVCNIRATDPQARIVLVGYSSGYRVAKRAAETMPDSQPIDLLIYLAGVVTIDAGARPDHVRKLVEIRPGGPLSKIPPFNTQVEGGITYDLGYVPHLRVPMNRQFQQILATELHEVATLPREQQSSAPLNQTSNPLPKEPQQSSAPLNQAGNPR